MANNGAAHATRTGHARKFLDTKQAMAAYLDRLSPDGLMVFTGQTVDEKVVSFRALLHERGRAPLTESAFVFGDPTLAVGPLGQSLPLLSMVVKPSGFSPEEVEAITQVIDGWSTETLLYAPNGRGEPAYLDLVHGRTEGLHVTDDKPFLRGIPWTQFTWNPSARQLADTSYVSGWVRIFTLILFGGLALGVGGAAVGLGGAQQRVPAAWVAYLTASGVGYMGVQIALIAKTELIVGNPLYAIAVNLAGFLVANALGAQLIDRVFEGGSPMGPWRDRFVRYGPLVLAGAVLLGVGWGQAWIGVFVSTALSWPLVAKIGAVLVAIMPAGIALGMFYPYGVTRLVGEGRSSAVGITYALATLSSVLGSALAMTAIIDLGFSLVLGMGVLAYGVAAIIAAARPTPQQG